MVIREALGLANEMLKKSGINSTVDAKVLLCHVTKKSELEFQPLLRENFLSL